MGGGTGRHRRSTTGKDLINTRREPRSETERRDRKSRKRDPTETEKPQAWVDILCMATRVPASVLAWVLASAPDSGPPSFGAEVLVSEFGAGAGAEVRCSRCRLRCRYLDCANAANAKTTNQRRYPRTRIELFFQLFGAPLSQRCLVKANSRQLNAPK